MLARDPSRRCLTCAGALGDLPCLPLLSLIRLGCKRYALKGSCVVYMATNGRVPARTFPPPTATLEVA